ncbi:MAG: nucleoside phosphorylase [Rikenellaceae bacterium]
MIKESELILNQDGSLFHLHLLPGELATTILLVGDPARCDMVASHFDSIRLKRENREIRTITGTYNNKPISVVSTGMGCDNIDIVLTEIDALFNVDLEKREPKSEHTELTIVRLGTSGAVNPELKIGDFALSEMAVGIDGLAYFYGGSQEIRNLKKEQEYISKAQPQPEMAQPYVVDGSKELVERFCDVAKRCFTLSANGFYGPQGRSIRVPLARADYFESLERGDVDNIEMECAAIYLLSKLLKHNALTVCAIIAQRTKGEGNPNYSAIIEKLVKTALDKLLK